MHLSSNGNKTIKDRMPAPAGRSFFYTRDTPTIGEIPRQPGTNETPESFRTDKLPEKVKPSHSRNKVNPVCKPLHPILAVYLFAGGGGGDSAHSYISWKCFAPASQAFYLTLPPSCSHLSVYFVKQSFCV